MRMPRVHLPRPADLELCLHPFAGLGRRLLQDSTESPPPAGDGGDTPSPPPADDGNDTPSPPPSGDNGDEGGGGGGGGGSPPESPSDSPPSDSSPPPNTPDSPEPTESPSPDAAAPTAGPATLGSDWASGQGDITQSSAIAEATSSAAGGEVAQSAATAFASGELVLRRRQNHVVLPKVGRTVNARQVPSSAIPR